MATAQGTRQGLAPNPMLAWVLAAIAALVALAVVTLTNGTDEGGGSSAEAEPRQAVVPAESGTAGPYEVGQFDSTSANVARSSALVPGQFDIVSGAIPGLTPAPATFGGGEVWQRQGAGFASPYAGTVSEATPRTYPSTSGGGEIWDRPDGGRPGAGDPPSAARPDPPANPRPQML